MNTEKKDHKKDDPKRLITVSIALPLDLCNKIDELADQDERPRSYWIRVAIREKLAREAAKESSITTV